MKKMVFVSFLFVFLLGACSLVGEPTTPAQDVNALYTQAVQTIAVQLTNDAASALATQAAGIPQATEPVVLPADTATPGAETPAVQLTSTEAPTNTPTPTATVTPVLPTPTLSSEDITKSLGGPTWRDNFDNEDNWHFSRYFKDTDNITMAVKDGQAVLKAVDRPYHYEWLLTWPKPEDFYVEITATTGSACSGLDKYGLIFRAPDPTEGYLVAFTCDGHYSVWYYDGDKEVDILDWKVSDKIKAGASQTNRLGIKAEGTQLTVYANGVAVATLTDSKRTEGSFGLMVGMVNTQNFTVSVDKLEYWDLTK